MNRSYLLYCLFSVTLFFSYHTANADTVSILSDEWYPMNGNPTSFQPGYMIEIAQVILAKHGHLLDYRLAPWKRSLLEVRQGNADCIVGAYKSDAPDFIYPQLAWGRAEFGFYVPTSSNWIYKGIHTLDDLNLGVISGYTYSPELDRYIARHLINSNVQVISGENALEKNIRKLLARRLDAIVAFKPVMNNELLKLGFQQKVKAAGTVEYSQLMYIACSPRKVSSHYYSKLFSVGIAELRKTGELESILKKYGLKDWQ
jgi:polar amino acid transport system substrate-binding protein